MGAPSGSVRMVGVRRAEAMGARLHRRRPWPEGNRGNTDRQEVWMRGGRYGRKQSSTGGGWIRLDEVLT